MDRIRVALVDDDSHFRECFKFELDHDPRLNCTGSFRSGEEALRELPTTIVDVVLVDLTMLGGMDGIETISQIKRLLPRLKAMMITNNDAPEKIYAAFGADADGYLPKRTAARPMADAIVSVYNGGVATGAQVQLQLVSYFRRRRPLLESLTPMERQVMDDHESEGGGYKHIADRLGISEHTVKFHVKNILRKSCAQSMAEALVLHKRAATAAGRG
jgi:DNA-binding NarL/FixJ family response regulator